MAFHSDSPTNHFSSCLMKKTQLFKVDYYRLIATANEPFELSVGKHNA